MLGRDRIKLEINSASGGLSSPTVSNMTEVTSSRFRAGAAKSSKSGHDMDYKTILELFVNDLLSILYRPEWPAASMFLMIISRLMVRSAL